MIMKSMRYKVYSGLMCATGEIISEPFQYTEKRKGETVRYSQAYLSINTLVDKDGKTIADEFDFLHIISLQKLPECGSCVKVVGLFQQAPWMTNEEGKWYKIQDCFVQNLKVRSSE